MKPDTKQHITSKRRTPLTSVRPIIFSIASALSLISAQAAHAQFAATPPSLQNESGSSGSPRIKHNVMFLIDDSGSMNFTVDGSRDSRITVTKRVLNNVLDNYKDRFNWGFQTLHGNGGANLSGQYTDTGAGRPYPPNYAGYQVVKGKVGLLTAQNGTPTTRRYYETAKNIVMPATEYRCQKSFFVLMSDGDANLSSFCRISRNWAAYSNTFDYYNSGTDSYFGFPANFSGVCTDDASGPYNSYWDANDGLAFFSQKLATVDFKTSGTDKAGKSWNGDAGDPKDGATDRSQYEKQLVDTFTIGFAGMSPRGERYLERAAGQGKFFLASREAELQAAFDQIFSNIADSSQNTVGSGEGATAPAPSSSRGIDGLAANVFLDPATWSSRIQFFGVKTNNNRVEVDYKNKFFPFFGERKTLINVDGTNTHWATDYDKYGKNSSGQDTGTGYFGLNASRPNEWREALVPWVIRSGNSDDAISSTYTQANGYSQDYRKREPVSPASEEKRNLGDIIGSPVLTIGGGTTSGGQVDGRNEFLVTAANDGMVHLFRSHNATNPYSLKLSYIPAAMERNGAKGGDTLAKALKKVADADYAKPGNHIYLVNGGITVRRTADDKAAGVQGQQAFLFGAMGQGGRGAYALNIGGKHRATGNPVGLNAPDADWAKAVPLFETAKGAGNTLGFTVGTPQIGRVALKREANNAVDTAKDVRYAGFLSSGYGLTPNSAPETALYVYEMLGQNAYDGKVEGSPAGALIRKIDIGGTAGLSEPTLVDADFDGVVDAAYAGDYAGNMYRFDLRGEDQGKWKVTKIFSGSPSQPITSAPAISRRSANKYVVIFGTGSEVYENDVENKTQQAVFGIFDDLGEDVSAAATAGDLQEQTLTESGNYREVTTNNPLAGKKGWMVKLGAADGERVVVKPTMILRTAVFSTRIYDQKKETTQAGVDLCIADTHKTETKSSSWIFGLNAETGGRLDKKDVRFIEKDGNNTSSYYSGLKHSGIVSFTYLDSSKLNDSPVTRDGDSGGSGTDQPFKVANTEVPNNKCFGKEAVRTLLTNTGGNMDIEGRICGIRRLSWREIFF